MFPMDTVNSQKLARTDFMLVGACISQVEDFYLFNSMLDYFPG